MKKLLLTLSILIGIGGGIMIRSYAPSLVSDKAPFTTNQKSEAESIGIPKRVIITKLEVNTEVEQVGMDEMGRMGVPENANNTAWYNLGPKPGEVGSAVIAGHLDTKTGPAIFYKLNTLRSGDFITVIDENQKSLNFKVTNVQAFSNNQFPINLVFATNDKPRLNLITCHGTYSRNVQSYNQRMVVFSELEP